MFPSTHFRWVDEYLKLYSNFVTKNLNKNLHLFHLNIKNYFEDSGNYLSYFVRILYTLKLNGVYLMYHNIFSNLTKYLT